jgi:hypothetical protein
MAATPIMAPITIANQAAGGTSPTSPARAAHPNSAPAEAAPNTRNRARGSRWRRATSAHAPMPTPAAITTRCIRSTVRLTAGVYAAKLTCRGRASTTVSLSSQFLANAHIHRALNGRFSGFICTTPIEMRRSASTVSQNASSDQVPNVDKLQILRRSAVSRPPTSPRSGISRASAEPRRLWG